MIQPQEIRIGNLLNHYELGIVEVIGVGKDYIHVIYNGETHYENIRSFSAIPLTEEILLKFRYKKIRDNEFLFDNHFIIFIKESKIDFCLFNSEGNDFFVCEIQFAHELQNLHYSIRKEELKFEDIS